METKQLIIMVIVSIISIILMVVVIHQRKQIKDLREEGSGKEATIEILSRGNIEVNNQLRLLKEFKEALERKNTFCILLLNIINTNWIKGIRRIDYLKDTSVSNSCPTLTLKYDAALDSYTAKPIFKKEDITKNLELFISIHGYHYNPLDHYVRALNINKAEFEEKGGVIPTKLAMEHLIKTLNP